MSRSSRKKKPAAARIGTDGNPMSAWQIRLQTLCYILLAWSIAILVLSGIALWASYFIDGTLFGLDLASLLQGFSASTLPLALLLLIASPLGIRGARNPRKLTPFFYLATIGGVTSAWGIASSFSIGIIQPTYVVSCVFFIAVMVCSWHVEGQTDFFERHPKPEDIEALESKVPSRGDRHDEDR